MTHSFANIDSRMGDTNLIDLSQPILIPDLYIHYGTLSPTAPFALILFPPKIPQPAQQILSFGKLLSDTRCAASHLLARGCIPRSPGEAQRTLCLLGNSGYTYYCYMVASFLIGWTPLLSSTRNSPAGLTHLLNEAKCTHIIYDSANSSQIQGSSHLDAILMDDAFDNKPEISLPWLKADYDFSSRTAKGLDDLVFYLHTSGSTGHPKLVPWSHKHALNQIRSVAIKTYDSPSYSPLPIFHAIGIELYVLWPFGSRIRPTFLHPSHPDSHKPINASSLLSHLRAIGDPTTVVHISPATLEELVNIGGTEVEELACLCQRAFSGGAPMRKEVGDRLAKGGVKIQTMFGASELGCCTINDVASPDTLQDWIYVRFAPAWNFLCIPDDPSAPKERAICELVALEGDKMSPLVYNQSDPRGFASSDLWAPHPDPAKRGLWRHVGRKGAMTVLSNGEKTDNKQLETLLLEDPLIARVVIFGAGRFLNGVILSPSPTVPQELLIPTSKRYVEQIWPTIIKTNAVIPSHSRLVRELVLVENAQTKPFKLTDKLSVRVKETLAEYEEEIEQAYKALEEGSGVADELNNVDPATLVKYITDVLKDVGLEVKDEEAELFDLGMDSLQAMKLSSAINAACIRLAPSRTAKIPRNIAYVYSTISKLVRFIQGHVLGNNESDGAQLKVSTVKTMVEKYTDLIKCLKPSEGHERPEGGGATFLITGVTGTVGASVVAQLLKGKDFKKAICLVRPGGTFDANKKRVRDAIEKVGWIDEDADPFARIEIYEAQLGTKGLGVSDELLEKIRCEVTHIIHCAWTLNFNWSLERFEMPHIAGVLHLIALALSSHRMQKPRYVFLSSIDSVHGYSLAQSVPEQYFDDPSVTSDTGYGQSKFVAEAMISFAAQYRGLSAVVIRSGQISGCSTTGYWNPHEYIPMLLKSSFKIKSVPDDMIDLHWVPSEIVGGVVLDIVKGHDKQEDGPVLEVYHIENPTSTPWNDLVKVVGSMSSNKVSPVPLREWIKIARQSTYTLSAIDVPAVKLLDFLSEYGRGPLAELRLGVEKTSKMVPSIDYGVIRNALLKSYITTILG